MSRRHGATGTLSWACTKNNVPTCPCPAVGRLGVSEVVGRLPEWSKCIGAPCIECRVGIASQTMNERNVPGAWNRRRLLPLWVGETWLTVWLTRDWRKERSRPADGSGIASGGIGLTAERKRADTVKERAAGGVGAEERSSRQREIYDRRRRHTRPTP